MPAKDWETPRHQLIFSLRGLLMGGEARHAALRKAGFPSLEECAGLQRRLRHQR